MTRTSEPVSCCLCYPGSRLLTSVLWCFQWHGQVFWPWPWEVLYPIWNALTPFNLYSRESEISEFLLLILFTLKSILKYLVSIIKKNGVNNLKNFKSQHAWRGHGGPANLVKSQLFDFFQTLPLATLSSFWSINVCAKKTAWDAYNFRCYNFIIFGDKYWE